MSEPSTKADVSEEPQAQAPVPPPAKPSHPRVPMWISLSGWYGVLAIFGAYYLLSTGKIEQDGLYQCLNATGAIGLAILCFKKRTWQPFALNLAWLAIACYALWRLFI